MTRLTFAELHGPRPEGLSPETFANRRRERELIGGYHYPLDVSRILDPARHRAYVATCAMRALREPKSSRNKDAEAAQRTAERVARARLEAL